VEILAQRKKHPWQITITDYNAINRNSKDCQRQTVCGIGDRETGAEKGNERRGEEKNIMERNKNKRRHGKYKRK
jgi:hypothetical protein